MDSAKGADAPRRVVEETKRLYADILPKPLESRQLARPSFKFVQDVAKSLITETRILRNVFNASDFETENKVWDRRRRCEFVQKLIDFVANHKQPVVGCVAAKLVAGSDPIKTNELLQSLAKIALAHLSGHDGNVKRPRTFTRETPSFPSKQRKEEPQGESNKISPVVNSRAIAPKVGAKRVDSEHRSRVTTSKRLSNTNGGRKSSVTGLKTDNDRGLVPRANRPSVSSVDESPDAKSGHSSVAAVGDEEGSAISPTVVKDKDPQGRDEPAPNQRIRDSVPRLSSSSTNQSNSQYIIVSESEIGKNIQQLRSSLEQLRSSVLEIGQFETKLKTDLAACLSG